MGTGGLERHHHTYLGAGELHRTRLTFLQQPLVKGLTPPRNLPVTCEMGSIALVWVAATEGHWTPPTLSKANRLRVLKM